MAEFHIRADHVDVEQIMQQIRARIAEKRGVDYTEAQIRELASVRLEKFLDPRNVRAELVRELRDAAVAPADPPPDNYAFEDVTIYESIRGPIRWIRKLLNPLLKLFFNPNPIIGVLNQQGRINAYFFRATDPHRQRDRELLTYEVLSNLVVELTRTTIEVKNLKMRLESMATRLEFDERRARALEASVQYKPEGSKPSTPPDEAADDDGEARRKRRRRRGRRRGAPETETATNDAGGAASEGRTDTGGETETRSESAGVQAPQAPTNES